MSGDLVGWWGPPTGSPVDKGYQDATTFDAMVTDGAPAGDYTMTLELVEVDGSGTVLATLATDVETMAVHENALAVPGEARSRRSPSRAPTSPCRCACTRRSRALERPRSA